jgi:hypothetical protein
LNERLITLVRKWQDDGSPKQEGFDWTPSKKNWVKAFPENKKFIGGLPMELDRIVVREICESSDYTVKEKFLTVMIWGYGDRGYGPYRVTQMLAQENAEKVLAQVFEICRRGDPKNAYEFLRKNRIRTLGPSYASKFITFCTPREISAPIFDSFIALWVDAFASEEFAEVPTSSEVWNLRTYSRYLDWVKEHSQELDCYPDDVELVIFRDAESKFGGNSNWQGK